MKKVFSITIILLLLFVAAILATPQRGSSTSITEVMTDTATMDFPSTLPLVGSDLTATITGASTGDIVVLGIPSGSMTTDGIFYGWVSSSNTVTVRFRNLLTVGSVDPSSGSFKVMVIKF
jgi:hypothetical protein